MKRSTTDILFWLALLLIAAPQAAYAYLDVSSISYFFQVAVVSVVGVVFAMRTYIHSLWLKFTSLFSRRTRPE